MEEETRQHEEERQEIQCDIDWDYLKDLSKEIGIELKDLIKLTSKKLLCDIIKKFD